MVDAQPVDEPLVEPPPDLDVRLVEDRAVLDPDAGQRVDREEPPVVEPGVGEPPRDQLVVLLRRASSCREPAGRRGRGSARRPRSRRPRSRRSSSSPTTGMRTRPPPASQSTSNASAWRDDRPCVRRSHHHAFSRGVATPTWLGTMSTSTPIPSRRASADSAASPSAPPRAGSTRSWSTTSYPWSLPGSALSSGER